MMRFRHVVALVILVLILPQPVVARDDASPAPSRLAAPSLQLSVTDAVLTPQQADPDLTRFDPALLKRLLAEPDGEPIRGIVMLHEQPDVTQMHLAGASRASRLGAMVWQLQAVADRSQLGLRTFLETAQAEQRVRSYRPLWIVNGIAVEGARDVFWEMATRPDVSIIFEDRLHRLPQGTSGQPRQQGETRQVDPIQWNVLRVQADRVWDVLGVTGEGVVVANLDSGVDWDHPYLKTHYRGYTGKPFAEHDGNWYCATDEGYTYPGDGLGHGTHTMGIMVGQNGVGVAPGARWIAAKVFDNQGFAFDSWIHDGFQWVLAPNDDPALAPDIVNSSWGSRFGSDERFRPDVQALRAAGILPVFSAGNDGPGSGTVGSPGSYPDAFAVGATDKDDLIALFSSRGPSPWDEVKPEVSAPGVDILSTTPGGALSKMQGTSMAAPHVSGLAALMRQVNPGLTVDEMEAILTETATPLGSESPNDDYGWGLVNAYAAVVRAGNFGRLTGHVTDDASGLSIANAVVRAVSHGGLPTTTTTTDAAGTYTVGLGADRYDVTVSAFGYVPQTEYGVEVVTGVTTTLDVALVALPTGTLLGTVQETGTGAPLQASVYVPGSPQATTSDAGSGAYELTLPIGTHVVRAEAPPRHRFVTATVTITADANTYRDFVLEPAPAILLVDGGAWYNQSQRQYYQEALESLRYSYDQHIIANVHISPTDVPTESTFLPYDLVIWSAPLDGPGFVGASSAITTFLSHGGRLFLSGQDVAFWDGGGSGTSWYPYLRDYLQALYVSDNALTQVVEGQGPLFAGLTITIAGSGGADNQATPDVVRLSGADHASSAWTYAKSGSGGQIVGQCLPYRAVYLAFGFEAINDPAMRREVMRRSIDWLVSPPQPAGIEIVPGQTLQIVTPGGQISHTVRLRNTGELIADTYAVDLVGGVWPSQPLYSAPLALGACASTTLQVLVDVPPDIGWHVYDTVTLVARSTLSPALEATATLRSKTPAPVLLVDGTRFFSLDGRFREALDGAGIPYDYHRVKYTWPLNVPSDNELSRYPVVVWFTGYDWYQALDELQETRLMTYLDGGGRLFLSSQDYLYYGHDSPLATTYLGVLEYDEGLETTHVLGEPLHPIGWGLGPYTLTYTYTNWSDTLVPIESARVAMRGLHRRPTALTHQSEDGDGWRTAFSGFSFETLDANAAQTVMGRTVGWLSWLGASTWEADRRIVSSGDEVTMTCVLRNDGWEDVAAAHFAATLPAELSLVGGPSGPGTTYHPLTRTVTWEGGLARGEMLTISMRVLVAHPLASSTYITFPAQIGLDDHHIQFERPYILRANAPDLSPSTMTVAPTPAHPFEVLTYTLTVRNAGLQGTAATLSVTAPYFGVFTGTLDSGGIGSGSQTTQTLSWTGPVGAGDEVTLRYRLALNWRADGVLVHEAWVSDQYGEQWPVEARTEVRYWTQYLPEVFR